MLVLILPATVALAANNAAQGQGAEKAAAQSQDKEEKGGNSHCEDSDNPGHKDCKPENNPNPQDPPCDADHGHPADRAPQCQDDEEPCPDADGDGVCDADDECPDDAGPAENNGCPEEPCPDADGDGVCDADDECPDTPEGEPVDENGCPDPGGGTDNLCTGAAGDPGLLTDDTLGQTLWDGGLSALSPLTEDPERNGEISGPLGEAGEGQPFEVLTDELSCGIDLLLDEETFPVDL